MDDKDHDHGDDDGDEYDAHDHVDDLGDHNHADGQVGRSTARLSLKQLSPTFLIRCQRIPYPYRLIKSDFSKSICPL